VEPEDESPNSLTREGREERGEGGGVGGWEEEGEMRSMTSHGFIHSSLGIADTLVHVHVGLGFTGTHGAPLRLPQSLFPSLVFASPVYRTGNIHRTELDRTMVQSFSSCSCPHFGSVQLPVAMFL